MHDSSAINDRTDYYELFGVEENASQDQLKKAYRKAAMKWHPDRNHNNVEEATRVFQIIEHAYSILSDPHERAWYDGHRHAVVNEFGEFDATNVDIEGLFGAGAFTGFNDGPNGFYTVFQKAFQELGEEEKSATKIPLFGDSNSPYEKVAEFYNFWTCFTTKRSFAFKDVYRLKDAPNGRYKRAMNQENEKARQKAQRDFVQSVRELALFAKKRDPRVKKHLEEVEKQIEEKRKLQEMKKLEKQKEFEKQLESILNDNSNQISYNEKDIIYLKEFDKEETEPQWHCDYCGRDMSTESAFKQHCNTKKHKKLSASARKDFLADPSLFEHTKYTFMLLGLTDYEIEEITGKPAEEFFNNEPETETKDEVETEEEEIKEEFTKKKGKQNKKQNQNQNQNQNNKNKNKNKNKNSNNKNKNDDDDDDDLENDIDDDNDDDDDDDFQAKNGKNKNNKNQNNNNNQGKKGKGKNNQNQQNQNKNNQQKIPKKEKHKLKMQRQKEAREKAELEELEKQKQKQREEKEKIESIISKSQSSDIFNENSNENDNNNDQQTENKAKEETQNYGPKLSKKEKKRLRQLEEARKRFLIQDEEEEEEKAEKAEEEKVNENDENLQIEEEEKDEIEPEKENENETQNQNQETTEKVAKKEEKVIEIIDENGNKVKVTMTDNFDDDENEVKDDDQDQDQVQSQQQNQNQNQNQNQKAQFQQKGKKNKKGPKKAPPGMFMCRKCHAVFPSKTKLFKHLEETNHATAYG